MSSEDPAYKRRNVIAAQIQKERQYTGGRMNSGSWNIKALKGNAPTGADTDSEEIVYPKPVEDKEEPVGVKDEDTERERIAEWARVTPGVTPLTEEESDDLKLHLRCLSLHGYNGEEMFQIRLRDLKRQEQERKRISHEEAATKRSEDTEASNLSNKNWWESTIGGSRITFRSSTEAQTFLSQFYMEGKPPDQDYEWDDEKPGQGVD